MEIAEEKWQRKLVDDRRIELLTSALRTLVESAGKIMRDKR